MKNSKKLISLTLVMIMIFSVLSIAPFTVNAAGDSVSNATSYVLGVTTKGSLTSSSTKDFYKFTLTSSSRINLSVNAFIEATHYFIYDANGNGVWEKTYQKWNYSTEKYTLNEKIDLTSGTYYFAITQWIGTGNYNFLISSSSASESFKESLTRDNNSITKADSIVLNTSYKGQLAANDSKDFYKFTIPTSGRITLTVNASIEATHYFIYDSRGNGVWEKTYQEWNGLTEKYTLSEKIDLISGTYYFGITQWYGTGNYNFKASFTNAQENFKESEFVNNNSIRDANSIFLNTEYKGQLAENDPKDFYEFNLDSSEKITLSVEAYINETNYFIYDSSGNEIWSKTYQEWDSTKELLEFKEDINLSSGTYYLCICRHNGSGNYDFAISKYVKQLATPKISKFQAVSNGLNLKWEAVSGAEKYCVFRLNNDHWKSLAIVSDTDYTDKTAKPGNSYTYTLCCVSADGKTIISSYDKDGVKINYATTPKLTKASYVNDGVKITWEESTNAVSYCVLYTYDGSNGWERLGNTTSTSFTHKTGKIGELYTYSVICTTKSGKSYVSCFDSKGLSITYKNLKIPKISKFEAVSNGLKLQWSAISGVNKYQIYRKTDNDTSWKIIGTSSSTSYVDKTAKAGNTYIYTMCCLSSDGKTVISSYDQDGQRIKYATTPKLIKATYIKGGVKIWWNESKNAVSYRVLCKYSGSNGWKTLGDTTSTSFIHKTGKTNNTYTYTVRCTTKSGKSYVSYFDAKGVSKKFIKFATPKISKFESVSNGIKLKWDAVSGIENYCLYRKNDTDTSWKSIAIVKGTSYVDKTAKAGNTYNYTLCCMSADKKTVLSSRYENGQRVKFATTPKLKKPTYVKGGVKISWNKSDNAVSYRVLCKYDGSNGWKKLTDTTSTSFTHKTGKTGRVYTYTVRCTTKSGKSYVSYFDKKGVNKKFKK